MGDQITEDFKETHIPQQHWVEGIPFPRVLVAGPAFSQTSSTQPPAQAVGEAIRRHKEWVESLLHSSGAVLLRGFPIHTAHDFNDVVVAFGYEELPYVGGAAPRTNVLGRVFTTNDSPPDQPIPFHHEMAQITEDFKETHIPQQHWVEGIPFPRVLVAGPAFSQTSSTQPPAQAVGEAIRRHKEWVESLLHSSGAVLLRGFPIHTAHDFNEVVVAFGYDELPYVGGSAPRTNVLGRVFTTNDSPPDQPIPFHHEMAQVLEYPAKLFFYCEVEPAIGGETPIVLSHLIYKRMAEKFPDFAKKLEETGLLYIRILGEDDDLSSPIGRGWHSTFLTKDKDEAEKRAARIGTKLEWLEDGGVKTIMGPISAIKVDLSRGRKIWFNSMVTAFTGWKDSRNDPEKAVTFGDGTPLPPDVILDCLRILDEEAVAIPWRKGDVLLLDNLAALHSRRSFEPPRRVLASLCK